MRATGRKTTGMGCVCSGCIGLLFRLDALRPVHRAVRRLQRLRDGTAVVGPHGDPDAHATGSSGSATVRRAVPPPRPTAAELTALAEVWNRSEILRHNGMRVAFEPDRVVVELPEVRAEHLGGLGTSAVNGMVLAGLFDLAVGSTVVLVNPRRRSATVQLSMSFERAVFGRSVRCEAWVDRAGQRTLFASARILDEQGQVCARCQAVVAISRQSLDEPQGAPGG